MSYVLMAKITFYFNSFFNRRERHEDAKAAKISSTLMTMLMCQPLAFFAPPLRPLRLSFLVVYQLFNKGKQVTDGLSKHTFTPISPLATGLNKPLEKISGFKGFFLAVPQRH